MPSAARPIVEINDPAAWSDAVVGFEGPQIVLAGPGTGKTEFLARRVAALVDAGVSATAIVVLTFSRRAAAELEARIGGHLSIPTSGATASTFHSFAHRLMETHLAATGREMPVLMTGPEQVQLVGELLESEDPDHWPIPFRPLLESATFASEVADFVMRCQERLLTPEALAELASERADWAALPGFIATYRRTLTSIGRIDYGSLMFDAVEAVETSGVADQFDYVVVDEYQDTSPAQARLAETVASPTGNITVAADPHQSIYSFRGAELDNVEGFSARIERRFGSPPKTLLLPRSFRVPGPILESALRLVAPNPRGITQDSSLVPADGSGSVEAYTFDQRSAEAEWIASEIERLHISEGLALASIAVLVRSTRHLLPELSRALDRRRIPHDRPNTRLVDHAAIQMIGDVVTAATCPPGMDESERSVRRLLLGPLLSLPLGRERELVRLRRRKYRDWAETIAAELPESAALGELISERSWATELPAVDGFWYLWDRLPHIERLVADPERAEYRSAWSSLARMLERQTERDPEVTLSAWFDSATSGDFEESPLLRFSRPDNDRLVVTTLHQAKGLEFDVVFIADAIEGVFPDTRRSRALLQPQLLSPLLVADPAAQISQRLAEERRIAYTATTRARRRVVWTATTAGIDEGERRPSRFVLAAINTTSFENVGPPPDHETSDHFAPLTMLDAEARIRRLVTDPGSGSVDRLAGLLVLAHDGAPWDPRYFAGVPKPGPDTGVIGEHIRLSPSQATLYHQCPRQYVLERRLRSVELESPYLSFGSIVHEVLELAEGDAIADGRPHADYDLALRRLAEVWERDADFGTPEVNEAWFKRALTLIEQIYEAWPGGDDEPVALEMELNAVLGGVEWIGRADRIDRTEGGLKIVDYKTSKTGPALKEAASSLQLGFYVIAAGEHPDLEGEGPPVAAELWYPLAKRRRVFPFDMKHIDEVTETLESVASGISSEDWAPKVGTHCERCSFRLVCPAWPDGRNY